MIKILKILVFLAVLAAEQRACGQGWVAKVDLNFGHLEYAYEKITKATFTFSGQTVSASSETGFLGLVIHGTNPINGDIELSITGIVWEPYEKITPYDTTVAASFTENFTSVCEVGFFEVEGRTSLERIFIWIRIYPRLEISSFIQECDGLTLNSNTCSPAFIWEVSDNLSTGFRVLEGKEGHSVKVSREELVSLGFANPYGRKYFRATGESGTTSQLQAVEIYYPGPAVSLTPSPPECSGGMDGNVRLSITSPSPLINDFVVTLFRENAANPLEQKSVLDAHETEFSKMAGGDYMIRVENNTSIGLYGACWSDHYFRVNDPDPIVLASNDIADFNGFQIKCSGGNDGRIKITPSGGSGMYAIYQWTPSVSVSDSATHLTAGTYSVKVKDSNNCWSNRYDFVISAPEALSATLLSTGGKNGFDVSCYNKMDGELYTEIAGGVAPFSYQWMDSSTTPARIGVGAGAYTVKVTDRNGCSVIQSTTLTAPEPISFSIAVIDSIACSGGSTGSLQIQSVLNSIGSVRYTWSSGETGPRINGKSAGSYSAVLTDDQGCSATAQQNLTEPPPYSLEIFSMSNYNGSPIRCAGESNGELIAVLTDPTNNIVTADQYFWFVNGEELASGTHPTISNLPAGLYKAKTLFRGSCTAEKYFELKEPSPVEVRILGVGETEGVPISCDGDSGGRLEALVTGGTGTAYSFTWENGQSGPERSALGTGTYMATATDVNGCTGRAIKIIGHPIDLGGSIVLCQGQTHMLDPGPHWKNYSWKGCGGFRSDSRSVIISDAGMYTLEAVDELGCIARDTFLLETSTDLLRANFLLSSTAYIGDTVVAIDISWPVPERAIWKLPEEMKNQQITGDIVFGRFESPGTYEVTLAATLGECYDDMTKLITISDGEDFKEGRLGHERFVKEFTLYPNPNDGAFDVILEILDESPIAISIWNALTSRKIVYVTDRGSKYYSKHFDLRPLSAGAYSMRVDHALGTAYMRFIVK